KQPLEDPRSIAIATPLPTIDSSHSVKPDNLEGPNSIAGTDPASTGSTTSAVVSSEISHNDYSTASAKDAFVPAESESPQMQSSLDKTPPLEYIMTDTIVEANMASTALFTSVESLQRESVLDSITCQPKQSYHAHAGFSDRDKSLTPNISSDVLSKRAAKNLDTEFASLASCSNSQAYGDRYCIRQANSSIKCPNGGVQTAGAEYHSKFEETMQECQSSIPLSYNSLTIHDRASKAFYESTKLINLSSSLSAKYNLKPLDGVYQSLPLKFEKLMKESIAYSIDTNLPDPSYDSKKFGGFGRYSLDFDHAFRMSDDLTYGSSNAHSDQEDSDVPLNLSIQKYNVEGLSGRTKSSSDHLGAVPGFTCFSIDEDSTLLGKNENQVQLSGSIGRNHSMKGLGGKNSLGYCTSNIYQRKGTGSLDLISGKSNTRKTDQHARIRVNLAIKNPKENGALSIGKPGKVGHPLHDRLIKTEMSFSKSERSRNKTNLQKGCNSVVSNMSSFIPLVKQKQHPPKSRGD
ncbi:hypothetical protein U9M48_038454, partial [Paspalum notatum var. saurae]